MIEITENDISIEDVIDSVRTDEAGAVVMFIGTVRAEPGLEGLELESYKDMALEKLHELRKLALDKFSIIDLSILHRIGKMTVGEDIVTIVVSAAHRTDAFSACKFLIDELKVTAPIWKKELGPGTWVAGNVPKQGKIEIEKLSGMVDISSKEIVHRTATAEGYITLLESTIESIKTQQIKKGDVLEAAKLAALNAVKQTPMLIPLCHPVYVPVRLYELSHRITLQAQEWLKIRLSPGREQCLYGYREDPGVELPMQCLVQDRPSATGVSFGAEMYSNRYRLLLQVPLLEQTFL